MSDATSQPEPDTSRVRPVDEPKTSHVAGSAYAPPAAGSRAHPAGAPARRPRVARLAFGEDEELEKDLITFRLGSRRRLVSTALIAVSFFCAKLFAALDVSYATIGGAAVGAVATNWLLTTLALRLRRWWFRYAFAAFDAVLISCIVYTFASPGLLVIYFLAIVPYSFDRGRVLGYFTALACAGGFFVAMLAARGTHHGPETSLSWIGVDAILLLLVSHQIVPIASKLISRVRETRECMAAAEQGDLTVRARSRYADELGFLQRSFDRMLEEIGQLIASVQHESDEVAAVAEQLAASASEINVAGSAFAATAGDVHHRLQEQRDHALAGVRQTDLALEAAGGLRTRAAAMEADSRDLVAAASSSREATGRAADSLVAIGEKVRESASAVSALAASSDKIGKFALAVSGIARQTNLLALNAAIEAARAGEHGKGFAVVADEVAKLAAQSDRAAKEIAGAIAAVREQIGAAASVMTEGEEEVRGIGSVAADATASLGAVLAGVERIATVIGDAAAVSRDQSDTMSRLADAIRSMETVSVEAAARAEEASSAAASQTSSLNALSSSSQQLAELAERLRRSITRFTVTSAQARG